VRKSILFVFSLNDRTKETVAVDNGGGGNWGVGAHGDINQIKTIAPLNEPKKKKKKKKKKKNKKR